MHELSFAALITLYVLLVLIGFITMVVLVWQFKVLKGESLNKPDGTVDGWH